MAPPAELIASILAKWGDLVPGPQHVKHHVAIVGAGVSGLVAARILQLHGHSVTLFEREESAAARFQGGTLDIHPESGQVALELAGLTKAFRALARPEGEEFRIVDKHATTHHADDVQQAPSQNAEDDAELRDRPEVDRGQLRQILLDSLEAGTVEWGSAVKSAEAIQGGSKVRPIFEPGSASAAKHGNKLFDTIIGADGTWSHIRSVLSPAKPEYTGVVCVELSIHEVDTRYPEIASLVGQGTLHALSDKKSLIAQRNSGGNIRTYAFLRVPLAWVEETGIASMAPADASAFLRTHFYADWSPRLLALLDASAADAGSESYPVRALFQLQAPHAWKTFPGGRITLVGDAAHVAYPNGEGANLAMLDGAEVALAIASARDGTALEGKISEFEKVMVERGAESAKQGTMMRDEFIFPEGGAAAATEMFRRMAG